MNATPKAAYFLLLTSVLSLPFVSMLLQLYAIDTKLDGLLHWLAFDAPVLFARSPGTLDAVAGCCAAFASHIAFAGAIARTSATFVLFQTYSFSQSMAFLMPARLLPADICEKCLELDPLNGDLEMFDVVFATLLVIVLWFVFIGLPLGIVFAGFHLFFIRFFEALRGH